VTCDRGPCRRRFGESPTHGLVVLLAIVGVVAGCGSSPGSTGAPRSASAVTNPHPASDVSIATTTPTTLPSSTVPPAVVSLGSVPIDVPDTLAAFDPNSTSTLPPATGPVDGALAAWDMCARNGPMQVIDADSGRVLTTVGLAGRPAWSPDRRHLASLDNADGAVRVADITTGQVRTVAELHVPPFTGDDCDTSGRVDWSPDGTTLLVTFNDFTSATARSVVSVVQVDTAAQATLFDEQHSPLDSSVGARWLDDGEVMIAEATTDGRLMVEHGEPGSWPPALQTLAIPKEPSVGRPAIAPDGDHVAIAVYGPPPPPPANLDPSANGSTPDGAILMVDVASGHTDTVDQYAAGNVSFAADSTGIAFIGASGLLVVPVGSTEPLITPSFTAPLGGLDVSWSPDGLSIATSNPFVQHIDLATGIVHELIVPRTNGGDWVTEWQPK
jgi:WD40 repeat protein